MMLPEENVWDYPRPPRLEQVSVPLAVEFAGRVIARSVRGCRVLETSHPPTYYFPPEDVAVEVLKPAAGRSLCEWKGVARYLTLQVGLALAERAAWSFPDPTPAFSSIAGHFAFYPWAVDKATVGDMVVVPQPGHFYGGWITPNLKGPFKGGAGTSGW